MKERAVHAHLPFHASSKTAAAWYSILLRWMRGGAHLTVSPVTWLMISEMLLLLSTSPITGTVLPRNFSGLLKISAGHQKLHSADIDLFDSQLRCFTHVQVQVHDSKMNIAICRLMGLALEPQLPPLDVKSVIIIRYPYMQSRLLWQPQEGHAVSQEMQ